MTPHSSAADNPILESLPDAILTAMLTYASESELRPDAVIEGALKHLLELDTTLSDEPRRVADEKSLFLRCQMSFKAVCGEAREPWGAGY